MRSSPIRSALLVTLMVAAAALSGCGSTADPTTPPTSGADTGRDSTGDEKKGASLDDAKEVIGDSGMIRIAGDQMTKRGSYTDWTYQDGRLTLISSDSFDQQVAQRECGMNQGVLRNVGVEASLWIAFTDRDVDCAELMD